MTLFWNPFAFVTMLLSSLFGSPNTAQASQALTSAPIVTTADSATGLFDAGRAPFDVRLGDDVVAYRVMGVPVLPGQARTLEVVGASPADEFTVHAAAGTLERTGASSWTWTPPTTPGLYPIEVSSPRYLHDVTVNAFVVVPWRPGLTQIDGYAIGRYPATRPSRHADAYEPPLGFVAITPETRDALVTPHFTLGQLQCKEGGASYPKFVVLREPLLVKLETLLASVNAHGIDAPTLTVMSGYRTPQYNHGLGNVLYSRHTWGDAADVYVDVSPKDGRMDDLNGDGRIDEGDARWLANLVETMKEPEPYAVRAGGIGTYEHTTTHGPFVHMDARGFVARWEG